MNGGFDKNKVETKMIEFKKQQDYLNTLDEFTKHLTHVGYTDRAILLHISPMLNELIIKNGGKNE